MVMTGFIPRLGDSWVTVLITYALLVMTSFEKNGGSDAYKLLEQIEKERRACQTELWQSQLPGGRKEETRGGRNLSWSREQGPPRILEGFCSLYLGRRMFSLPRRMEMFNSHFRNVLQVQK